MLLWSTDVASKFVCFQLCLVDYVLYSDVVLYDVDLLTPNPTHPTTVSGGFGHFVYSSHRAPSEESGGDFAAIALVSSCFPVVECY